HQGKSSDRRLLRGSGWKAGLARFAGGARTTTARGVPRCSRSRLTAMDANSKTLAGFLLLPAGWLIVLTALALLPPGPARAAFVLAGLGVQIVGLAVVVPSFTTQSAADGERD